MKQEIMGWQWHHLDRMQIIAPRYSHVTQPTPQHSIVCRADALPDAKQTVQGTEGNHYIIIMIIITISESTKRPHRRRTWTVQLYSPGGANIHPTHASLDPFESTS